MDLIFLIKDRRPPVHFPPPTRRTALTDELRATTTSAAQKGFTDTTSPTSTNVSLSETDGNNVYPVRYFRSFDLDDDDVRAVWPAILINTDNAFRKQKASMTRYKSKIQNAVLSVGGPMSRDRWLSRMIIGFVSIYDYKVHLHNIQVAILRARIVPTTESDDQRRFRMRALGALRMSFIIDKLDRSIADARRKSFNAEEHEAMGDFSDATYIDYLNELRTQFAVMDF